MKDFVLYPFARTAYETDVKTVSEQLVGNKDVTQERLAPGSYVHVHGELWQGKAERGHPPITVAGTIRGQAARGLTSIATAE